ncbi:MAG: ABC transporter ATP-binding protein [Planctomycetota bacterium]
MDSENILSIEELAVSIDEIHILREVTLAITRGEVVTLLGGNGSGKTVTLNTISGFFKPHSGAIWFDGKEISGRPPHWIYRQGVVQVSQNRDLFPNLTVEENLKLGAALAQNKGNTDSELEKIYTNFPRLGERKRQKAQTLSGGEQQMLAIGRGLMSRPKILLLDEPSGGLSPQFVQEIETIILSLKKTGSTMLLVEQNVNLALSVADRYYILRNGFVTENGDVGAIQDNHDELVRAIYL